MLSMAVFLFRAFPDQDQTFYETDRDSPESEIISADAGVYLLETANAQLS